jgi:uncharacterized protein
LVPEQNNRQKVESAYRLFVHGDVDTLLTLVTGDVEFLPPVIADVPWVHPWRGRKEVEQYFKTLAQALEFQEFAADEFIVGGNSVVVLGHERCLIRASGRVVEAKWVQIFDFRDGLVCRHREYTDTAAWGTGFQ